MLDSDDVELFDDEEPFQNEATTERELTKVDVWTATTMKWWTMKWGPFEPFERNRPKFIHGKSIVLVHIKRMILTFPFFFFHWFRLATVAFAETKFLSLQQDVS